MAVTKDAIEAALERGHTIDITTKGRKSGKPRTIEIVFHNIGGRIYISGTPYPGKRKWLLNLEADPHFTFHLKGRARADLPAVARVIDDEAERRHILVLDRQEVARHPAEDVVHDRFRDRDLFVLGESRWLEAHMAELVDHEFERHAELQRV